MKNHAVKKSLLKMVEEDKTLRQQLLETGELSDGYNSDMEQVHLKNARKLQQIVDEQGFPKVEQVGKEGVEAAWLIIQHAISWPQFMRAMLPLVQESVAAGELPKQDLACLIDRIRFYEGKPQMYGTNSDWNAEGKLVITPVADEANLNQRRKEMGLSPLNDLESAQLDIAMPPQDFKQRQRDFVAWAKKVGWRD